MTLKRSRIFSCLALSDIQQEHCVLLMENGQLFIEPLGNAACFLNGSPVISRVLLYHGDRLLLGNNHFFRVNCPRLLSRTSNNGGQEQPPHVQPDFNFAREELVLKEMSNDPIQVSIIHTNSLSTVRARGLQALMHRCIYERSMSWDCFVNHLFSERYCPFGEAA